MISPSCVLLHLPRLTCLPSKLSLPIDFHPSFTHEHAASKLQRLKLNHLPPPAPVTITTLLSNLSCDAIVDDDDVGDGKWISVCMYWELGNKAERDKIAILGMMS
jgi:hypothetical protein